MCPLLSSCVQKYYPQLSRVKDVPLSCFLEYPVFQSIVRQLLSVTLYLQC